MVDGTSPEADDKLGHAITHIQTLVNVIVAGDDGGQAFEVSAPLEQQLTAMNSAGGIRRVVPDAEFPPRPGRRNLLAQPLPLSIARRGIHHGIVRIEKKEVRRAPRHLVITQTRAMDAFGNPGLPARIRVEIIEIRRQFTAVG